MAGPHVAGGGAQWPVRSRPLWGASLVKLGASQSIVQINWSTLLRGVLRHGCRVMESAFLLSRGRRAGSLVARAKEGRFAECSVKKGQVGGAVVGSWRLWWGRGRGAGRGGRRLPGALFRSLRSRSDKFQQCFDLKVHRFSSSTVVGHFCYAAQTCTYSANCADDRRDSLGAVLGPGC